jgi:carotenoid cleavage dioxygenase-like enzyme
MAHPTPSTVFPSTETFSGWNAPGRFQADVRSLEIDGKVPKDLHGAFFRIQPDAAFPPRFDDDIALNGDGNVSKFTFENGHVDFRCRYVRTAKFEAEEAARRALVGRYRNRYTDDPLVKDIVTRTTSNTHVIYHAGILMTLKEDGPPYEIDATTLETKGIVNFHGTRRSPTFSAHPKIDEKTGEMITFGYEAKGDGTPDICYMVVDKSGKIVEEVWIVAPYACMLHDFCVTENYVVFPLNTLKSSVEQLKRGEEHFYFDEKQGYQLVGILPRRSAKPEDARWFKTVHGFWIHNINAFEESGSIVMDASVWSDCIFPFFPNTEGVKFSQQPDKIKAPVFRYRFDPQGDVETLVKPERVIMDGTFEFGRIDDRCVTRRHENFWILGSDMSRFHNDGDVMFQGGFNVLHHYDCSTGTNQTYWPGSRTTLQEPVFIPRHPGAQSDDGYIILLCNRFDEMRNDLLLFEAKAIQRGPIATIKLPLRLRDGIHGSWVDHADIEKASKRSEATSER